MKRSLPVMPEPFPQAFRTMLEQVLRHAGRVQGARMQTMRSRHQQLQQSGTFVGHRSYVKGDDLRRIDWNAYARTGTLFLKLLAEEEARAATVLIDSSRSMCVGSPPRWPTAQRLAAVLGGLLLVHLDGVTVHSTTSQMFSGRKALSALLDHLSSVQLTTHDPITAVADLQRRRAPGRVHWISDFVDPSTTERTLLRLRRAGCRVTGWLPTIPDDFAIEAGGWRMVCDPETGREVPLRVDVALARAVTHELSVLQRQQQQVFASCGFPLQRVTLPSDSFDAGRWMEAGWSFRR